MYKTIQKYWPKDKDLPERAFALEMRKRVMDGELYDRHRHPFHYEMSESGEYVPLRERRPSVRNNMCRTVVDDSVSLLFSEGHFPTVEMQDEQQKVALHRLVKEMRLNEVMIDAATRGAVGSVAILLRVLDGRIFLNVIDTAYLTPQWNPAEPDTLLRVTERRKVDGKALRDAGYAIADEDLVVQFWFQREWDADAETWYAPYKVGSDMRAAPVSDGLRSVEHQLGFVPLVWIKNLPGGDSIDGKATFPDEAIDTQIEIDYQLSQAGRGLKFMSDPTLVIRNEASSGAPIIKGAANAIMVGQDGDAKLLEISGDSTAAVMAYVTHLREVALEAMHGNRASNEKLSAAQSGRALELLNQALVWLADRLRISYGEGAILDLMHMVVRISNRIALRYKDGSAVGAFDAAQCLSLRWPEWFDPTLQDLNVRAATLRSLCEAGLLSRATAIKILCAEYDIENPAAETLLIGMEQQLQK
jgi:hypothetical protein